MTVDPAAGSGAPSASVEPLEGELVVALTPNTVSPGPPASMLEFLDRVVSDCEKSAQVQNLMKSGSKAISRVVLSVGAVLALIVLVVALAAAFAGPAAAVGGGVAGGGAGAVWAGRTWWKRHQRQRAGK